MLEHKFCRYAIESYLCIKKQMTKDFTPAPNAIIVDAAFLNFITSDFKTNFERILNRELSTIDLSSLFTYIALDWGVTPGSTGTTLILGSPSIYFTTSSGFIPLNSSTVFTRICAKIRFLTFYILSNPTQLSGMLHRLPL